MWDATGIRIFCGLPHNEGQKTLNKVAMWRWNKIHGPTTITGHRTLVRGEEIYGGLRTRPENVADRFVGNHWNKFLLDRQDYSGFRGRIKLAWRWLAVATGRCDKGLQATYKERAQAEYHYTYEKDYD